MLPEKSNLVLHTIFKSATSIDIEVTDRVVFHFCKSSKNLGSLFKRFKRDPRIIITDLEEDRTSDMACIFDRPVFIPPDNDPGTGFVHIPSGMSLVKASYASGVFIRAIVPGFPTMGTL